MSNGVGHDLTRRRYQSFQQAIAPNQGLPRGLGVCEASLPQHRLQRGYRFGFLLWQITLTQGYNLGEINAKLGVFTARCYALAHPAARHRYTGGFMDGFDPNLFPTNPF